MPLTMEKTMETEAAVTLDRLKIVDERTGHSYDVAIETGTIRGTDLKKIRSGPDDPGLMVYDPAYMNTASCRSAITYIDGDKGILLYRGYPIEELAEHCSFLEVAYLLLHGELPNRTQNEEWTRQITYHTMLHESIKKFMDGFNYDAHPMGILVATVGALSTFYPDARNIHDEASRRTQIHRLVAKMPTLAAFA
ncbi:MAG TPA: citrate/2-methylcitrate synthase, partial [Thermoanaerobaculia bacterium]|nr:citrate/2-methylcitrate synthase [Thermoanaerobaculia bacterium]